MIGGEWEPITYREGGRGTKQYQFRPERDYSGQLTIDVYGWTGAFPVRNKDKSIEKVTFTIIVSNEIKKLSSLLLLIEICSPFI